MAGSDLVLAEELDLEEFPISPAKNSVTEELLQDQVWGLIFSSLPRSSPLIAAVIRLVRVSVIFVFRTVNIYTVENDTQNFPLDIVKPFARLMDNMA